MDSYNSEIADYLYEKYNLSNGTLIDIGCGKGHLLQKLSAKYPDVYGLGIDPSYEGSPKPFPESKLRFIADIFRPEQLDACPSLFCCRHVLEHILDLPKFLHDIRLALHSWLPVPFFIELRDLDWIITNKAFADFCFEQCNYFTSESIRECLRRSGFNVDKITSTFGDQYIWVEGTISPEEHAVSAIKSEAIASTALRMRDYFSREQGDLERIRSFLVQKKRENRHVVVWGLSTKGILFNFLIDPAGVLVDQCVDINQYKQGKFLPITGRKIQSPGEIAAASQAPVIIVMNPNYKAEIMALCGRYNLNADVYDMDQL